MSNINTRYPIRWSSFVVVVGPTVLAPQLEYFGILEFEALNSWSVLFIGREAGLYSITQRKRALFIELGLDKWRDRVTD